MARADVGFSCKPMLPMIMCMERTWGSLANVPNECGWREQCSLASAVPNVPTDYVDSVVIARMWDFLANICNATVNGHEFVYARLFSQCSQCTLRRLRNVRRTEHWVGESTFGIYITPNISGYSEIKPSALDFKFQNFSVTFKVFCIVQNWR